MEDIEIVNKYLPDYIGFVFAQSKRKVSMAKAEKLKDNLDSKIKSVGVFVDADKEEILKLYDSQIIDMAQLHGSESEEYMHDLKNKTDNRIKIIKAIEISQKTDLLKYNNSVADYLLLDSGKGSGKTFNWDLINENLNKDYFIAGGLDASNISGLIQRFNPFAVDLSSGLETDGVKDEKKISKVMEIIR